MATAKRAHPDASEEVDLDSNVAKKYKTDVQQIGSHSEVVITNAFVLSLRNVTRLCLPVCRLPGKGESLTLKKRQLPRPAASMQAIKRTSWLSTRA